MFTGLIQDVGIIDKIIKEGNSKFLYIKHNLDKVNIGDSIAINGVCLTVVKLEHNIIVLEATLETLNRTNLNFLRAQDQVNLEKALSIGSLLDGHIVQGHVDCIGTVSSIKRNGNLTVFGISYPADYNHLVVEKGSVALDGISLTISFEKSGYFEVSIISHTLSNTNIKKWKNGYKVNIEFDILGKYIYKQLSHLRR